MIDLLPVTLCHNKTILPHWSEDVSIVQPLFIKNVIKAFFFRPLMIRKSFHDKEM
ncbi:hypothetical protein D083_0447 [Dickeya solani RNS 08.23.3.1.A]|nr:hypothetical protein D083_0447 [Dickeya solani RNS 08.23.3.1.A]